MKGVILAAGRGSRLMPLTKVVPKCLLPVYDRPMIYYPLEVLKQFGIRDIAVVVSSDAEHLFRGQLGDGSDFGVELTYFLQEEPTGSAGALMMAREFIRDHKSVIVFGDNLFVGDMSKIIRESLNNLENGHVSIFAVRVPNPSDYGVIEIDEENNVLSIEEKPLEPKSNYIAPGLYVFDETILEKMDNIDKSPRGEYEMTDISRIYLKENKLKVVSIDQSKIKWFDTGNIDVMSDASNEIGNLTK